MAAAARLHEDIVNISLLALLQLLLRYDDAIHDSVANKIIIF